MSQNTLIDCVSGALDTRFFTSADGEPPAVEASIVLPEDARLVVATGENASGKTFFGRVLSTYARKQGLATQRISMEFRSESGLARVAVLGGSEAEDSTGVLSAQAVLGALRHSAMTDERHILILDEPDIGLSPSYAKAMGKRLNAYVADAPPNLVGLAVVTHSVPLMQGLLQTDPVPRYGWLRFGDDALSAEQVLAGETVEKSPDALEGLVRQGRDRYRAISRGLAAIKEEKAAAAKMSRQKRPSTKDAR